ncbi:SDR family oxidoreductase [Rugosimonospora africana]|uniref:Short-chain dehydrogenase n=1 Tax=Rugosimonospora africana TaxID=556532 RepID=A0A8J3QKX8_9ACTN|nr:SDR family oxidoreductase [Rugosimonospora africana]GIH12858.1 short-chain dehydrogenase [Rugosimonospora africana]
MRKSNGTPGAQPLAGERVLVTGGAGGLGAAVVDAVREAGGKPYVLDMREPSDGIPAVAVDLSDTRAAERAATELAEHAGGLDAVVTAAGIDLPGRLTDVPGPDWERVVQVDLLAPAAVVRACLPYLVESHGHVVTVASTLGLRALSDATAYCAAKFGVVGFTRALAVELAGRVDVTLLVPGGMRTNFFDGRTEQYRPGEDAVLNDPANVARAVLFALSQPPGCAVRELVITPDVEPSYP